MKYRVILILIISCLLAAAAILVSDTIRITDTKPDLIEINRIKISAESTESLADFRIESKYDFTIVSTMDENLRAVLFDTDQIIELPLMERLNRFGHIQRQRIDHMSGFYEAQKYFAPKAHCGVINNGSFRAIYLVYNYSIWLTL